MVRIDADLLARVEPRELVDLLADEGGNAASLLRVCRRALDRLRSGDVAQRAGILQAMAQSEEPQAFAGLDLATVAGWVPLWSYGYRSAFHQRLIGHTAPVLALAFGTIAGRLVLASAGDDQTVRVWDAWYGEEHSVLRGHTDHVVALAFARNRAGSLGSASRDGTFRVWDVYGGAATTITARDGLPVDVAFLPYQGREALVTATAADVEDDDVDHQWNVGAVDLWDPVTGEHLRRIHDGGEIRGIRVVPVDGRPLIAGHRDGEHDSEVLLWDPVTAAQEAVLTWRPAGQFVEKFGPLVVVTELDRTLIGADAWIYHTHREDLYYHTIVWWDARNREEVRRDTLERDVRLLAAATVDGQSLVATVEYHDGRGSMSGPRVSVAGHGKRVDMQGHLGPVRVAAFRVGHGTTLLATAGDDGAVLLWDAQTEHRHALGSEGGQLAVVGDLSEPVLAVGTASANINLIDPRTGAKHGSLQCNPGSKNSGHRCEYDGLKSQVDHCRSSLAAATIGDRSVIASCGDGTQAVLWHPTTGDVLRELQTRTSIVAFGDVDGRTVIATNGHGRWPTTVWDPGTGERIADLADAGNSRSDGSTVWSLEFGTVGGRAVLATGTSGAVRLWDPLTGTHLADLPGPGYARALPNWRSLGWRPKRGLAAGSDVLAFADDARVRVWDTARNELLSTVDELDGQVTCVALIPVGSRCRLVVGTTGGTVSLWDASTGVRLGTLATFPRPVTGLATATLDAQPHVFAQSESGRLTVCRLYPPQP